MRCRRRLHPPGFNWFEEEIVDGPSKSKCNLLVNMMIENGLDQHNNEISRPTSNDILDLILTNNAGSVSHTYIVPLACQTTKLLNVLLVYCLSIIECQKEPSLCITRTLGRHSHRN